MRPAVDALSRALPRHHVLALRRADVRRGVRSGAGLRQLRRSDRRRARRARRRRARSSAASRSAASSRCASPRRRPERTTALVLVVDAGPGLAPDDRGTTLRAAAAGCSARCSWPKSPWRLRREIAAALPGSGAERRRFAREQLRTLLEAPLSLSRMADARPAHRARSTRRRDCRARRRARRWSSPASRRSITSSPVDAARPSTRARSAGARRRSLERTGHLGSITQPGAFAEHRSRDFVDAALGVRTARTTHDAA